MASGNLNLERRVVKVGKFSQFDIPRQPYVEGVVWKNDGDEKIHREKVDLFNQQLIAAFNSAVAAKIEA